MRVLAFFSFLTVMSVAPICAQDLVYKAKNPNFGGDTFNYQQLLSSAQAQNSFSAPASTRFSTSSTTSLQDFQNSLNRQILSNLSRQIVSNQFGESSLSPGQYSFGNLDVNVINSGDGVLVTIQDILTGEVTELLVPFF